MDKRYQVFVSSTYRDLERERSEVIRALLELDCIPAGMELFPASDETQWELIKRVIDDCDYYILIIGGRYGSTDATGLSYTEKEFDCAVEKNIPVMVFPVEDPSLIPAGKTELKDDAQARLAAFREKATKDRMAKFWTSPDDLAGKVSRSLIQAIKLNPREGWIRAEQAGDPEAVLKLRNRIEELETQLQAARTSPPPGVQRLAQGGDEFQLEFQTHHRGDRRIGQVPRTWDRLIALLGPLMYDEAPEASLRRAVDRYLEIHVKGHLLPRVTDDCFQKVATKAACIRCHSPVGCVLARTRLSPRRVSGIVRAITHPTRLRDSESAHVRAGGDQAARRAV